MVYKRKSVKMSLIVILCMVWVCSNSRRSWLEQIWLSPVDSKHVRAVRYQQSGATSSFPPSLHLSREHQRSRCLPSSSSSSLLPPPISLPASLPPSSLSLSLYVRTVNELSFSFLHLHIAECRTALCEIKPCVAIARRAVIYPHKDAR